MDTLTKPEVTATPWKRVAAWGGPPLFAVAAVGAIWLFDAQGAAAARDTAYVLAAKDHGPRRPYRHGGFTRSAFT